MNQYQLIDNETEKQYEFHIEQFIPKLEYIKTPRENTKKIFLTHTEVPKELEGKGIGSALIKQVLEEIKKNDWTLVPLCPFVATYIKRHPEWKELVLKGVNIS